MRESFSLFLWNKRDPQTKEIRLKYYIRIFSKKYHDIPIYKMILTDTLYDIKIKIKQL